MESPNTWVRDMELSLRTGFHHSCIEQLFTISCLALWTLLSIALIASPSVLVRRSCSPSKPTPLMKEK